MTKRRDLEQAVRLLVEQGCTARPTKKGGYVFVLPGGAGTATLHFTNSDHRSLKNFRSVILRAGLNFPANL